MFRQVWCCYVLLLLSKSMGTVSYACGDLSLNSSLAMGLHGPHAGATETPAVAARCFTNYHVYIYITPYSILGATRSDVFSCSRISL